jgi:hypothetical protein
MFFRLLFWLTRNLNLFFFLKERWLMASLIFSFNDSCDINAVAARTSAGIGMVFERERLDLGQVISKYF